MPLEKQTLSFGSHYNHGLIVKSLQCVLKFLFFMMGLNNMDGLTFSEKTSKLFSNDSFSFFLEDIPVSTKNKFS